MGLARRSTECRRGRTWFSAAGTVLFGAACAVAGASNSACAGIVGLTQDYYETFCLTRNPRPLFCSDFDEGSGQSDWSYSHMTRGTITADTEEFRSFPAAMKAQSDATQAGPVVNVAVYKAYSLVGQTFSGTVDMDLRVDQADSGCAAAVIAQIGFSNGNSDYWIQFVVTSNGSGPLVCSINEVVSDGSFTGHSLSNKASLDLATWTHVRLTVTAPLDGGDGGKGTAALAFDGMDVSQNGTPIPITVPSQRLEQTLGVGITWASIPSAGWTVVYDNVIFNAAAN
jgi:hypothetical protein